jgi:hypothetical protein
MCARGGPVVLLDAGFSVISKNKRLTVVRELLAGPA